MTPHAHTLVAADPATEPTVEHWTIDETHSSVGFAVKHLMISTVRGSLRVVSGSVRVDPADVRRATIHVDLDAASVDTGVAARDDHLRSADFLDAATHPLITFHGRRVERLADGSLRVVGGLTIRGVTREVTLLASAPERVRTPWGEERAGIGATARIHRGDFGLTWNQALETGGMLVGDEIRISLDVQLARVEPARDA